MINKIKLHALVCYDLDSILYINLKMDNVSISLRDSMNMIYCNVYFNITETIIKYNIEKK